MKRVPLIVYPRVRRAYIWAVGRSSKSSNAQTLRARTQPVHIIKFSRRAIHALCYKIFFVKLYTYYYRINYLAEIPVFRYFVGRYEGSIPKMNYI